MHKIKFTNEIYTCNIKNKLEQIFINKRMKMEINSLLKKLLLSISQNKFTERFDIF